MPITLPASSWRGADGGQDQLDDTVVLLLHHAGDDPLAVHRERGEQEDRGEVRRPDLRIRRLLVRGLQRRRRQLRRRRKLMAEVPDRALDNGGGRGVDLRAEDEAILREQQQRLDLPGVERRSSGCRRRDHAHLHDRLVERPGRAPKRCGQTRRRRGGDRQPVGLVLFPASAPARSSPRGARV